MPQRLSRSNDVPVGLFGMDLRLADPSPLAILAPMRSTITTPTPMTPPRVFLAGLTMMAVTACSAVDGVGDRLALGIRGCDRGTAQLEGLDWSAAPIVDIRIRQDQFHPMVVGLVRDRAYVLMISNGDAESHGFRSPEFFRHAAVEQIAIDGTVLPARCITGIEIPAKGSAEIRLVALLDGTYAFEDPSKLLDLAIGFYEDGDGLGTIFVE